MFFVILMTLWGVYLFSFLYTKWKVYTYLLNNFKSPPRRWFWGTLRLFPTSPPGIFQTFQSLIRKYGKNFMLSRPIFEPLIIVTDPKDIEAILSNPNTKSARKGTSYRTLEPWLGTGLLTSYGEKWFTRRKIITPSFHFSILDGFVEVMSKQSDILIEHLRTKVGPDEVDIYPIINAFSLDVICETSMGVTVNALSDPNSEYVTSVKKMSLAIQKRLHHPLGKTKLYDLTSQGAYLKQLTKILQNFTSKVIETRRNRLLSNDTVKGSRMNFLDILLHATVDEKPLSNADIREEVDTFMFEGHDTTASGIAFTLYMLSRHSNVQDKVYQELMEVFQSKREIDINRTRLNELVYLDMVIKETLRLMPPVPGISRQLMEETEISGVVVPAKVNVALSIYGMHHDPDNFPDPDKFDPERFTPNNQDTKHTFTYVPFSAGGRNCIGQKFAMLDLKISIAKIIMNYKLLPGPEAVLQGDLILKSSNGIRIRLENR